MAKLEFIENSKEPTYPCVTYQQEHPQGFVHPTGGDAQYYIVSTNADVWREYPPPTHITWTRIE